MPYVLDTNVVSVIMKGDARVHARLAVLDPSDIAVPEPVFAEIAFGIHRLPKSRKKEELSELYTLVRSELSTAAWTPAVSTAFARLKATLESRGQRIADFDIAIAAHAAANDATLVSANVRDMARIPGIKLEDWLSS